MREHLYKGKSVDNGEWVYGLYVYDEVNNKHYIHDNGSTIVNGFEEIIPETVKEWTSLKDDNKTRIFEHDILEFRVSNGNWWRAVVKFGNPNGKYDWGWQLVPLKTSELFTKPTLDILLWIETELENTKCNVIGNIFDNPELLGASNG